MSRLPSLPEISHGGGGTSPCRRRGTGTSCSVATEHGDKPSPQQRTAPTVQGYARYTVMDTSGERGNSPRRSTRWLLQLGRHGSSPGTTRAPTSSDGGTEGQGGQGEKGGREGGGTRTEGEPHASKPARAPRDSTQAWRSHRNPIAPRPSPVKLASITALASLTPSR